MADGEIGGAFRGEVRPAGRGGEAASLLQRLVRRAENAPHEQVFSFQDARGVSTLSAAELATESFRIAEELQGLAEPGARVMLALSPGLEYAAALFACFAAKLVVVPAYPPRSRRLKALFQSICADAEPALALVDEGEEADVAAKADLPRLRILSPKLLRRGLGWNFRCEPAPDALALLQYTSGSTGNPKGVMLRHGAILANLERQRRLYRVRPGTRGVIWLPPYHDMGLGSGLLQPVYADSSARLMAPAYAMQQPLRWLKAISDTRAHVSGAPPSAYASAAGAAETADIGDLDLSTWRCAFIGAEPVLAAVLQAFTRAFGARGFRQEAFQPSFGLAEATLLVTGEPAGATLKADALGRVSCGRCLPKHALQVVDPATRRPAAAGEEGEIWIRGPSLADGYWRNAEATQATFGVRLARGRRGWLRSGDLGRLVRGRLWITGRMKDMLIFAGRNVHAIDIEQTVLSAAGLETAPNKAAALGVTVDGSERLAILLEARDAWRAPGEVQDRIRRGILSAVSRDHAVGVHELRFVPLGALPRTTSGKIRRPACAAFFAAARPCRDGTIVSGSGISL